ncbi:MAG: response regulator transcription factor [Bacteroidota bacterium]
MARILVVEDEPLMQKGLRDNLSFEGYEVEIAPDGEAGLARIRERSHDLVILDVMLPRMSGFDILKKVRAEGVRTPVLMLTARGEEIDKVLGLELGADDYLTKPFGLREMLARVKALLRRSEGGAREKALTRFGDVEVDFSSYTAVRGTRALEMTPKEFDVLKHLWEHRNRTVTREQLLTEVWGLDASVSTRSIDNFIVRLRQKLEEDPSHPRLILTIHGIGYKLVQEGEGGTKG